MPLKDMLGLAEGSRFHSCFKFYATDGAADSHHLKATICYNAVDKYAGNCNKKFDIAMLTSKMTIINYLKTLLTL